MTQDTEDVVAPPPIPNPNVRHGARRAPVDEALTFLRANRDTHSRWAEYFEQNPAVEAEYIATGVWEGAADQRRIEREYNAAIATFERTEADRQSLSDRIDVLEGVAVAAQRFCADLCEDSPDVPQPELKALHEALDAWEATQ